ncbi:MAG TPA: Vms1/Ankzf1 family peptidyl-tRNA hydrolase [Nocardioides sp.]|nr:Vms1/Ankzf1 family peptidyl-tRNA hydrolase [Nocardioides sp.]
MRLQQIRNVLDHPGPYVTLHLDVSRATEDARQQAASRWTTTRHELEHQGVSQELIEQLGERLAEPTHLPGEVRRTIVASPEQVLLDDARSGGSSWPETVSVGPLPDLAGWLSMTDGQFPFALVRTDRVGADIEMYVAPSRPAAERTTVAGDTFDITKLPEGDWAQDKYQRRAENTWAANARLVAEQLRALDARYRPRLVVLCGDVRACAELASVLGEVPGATVVTVGSGGRAAGTSEEALWDDVHRLLDEQRARDTDELLQELARGTAVGEGVITGPDRVADAFVKGGVERLVLDLEDAHNAQVTAADHEGLALPGAAPSAGPLPADQVLVAAAAMTDAELAVLPHEVPLPQEFALAQGVAATLRWDDRTS